MVWTFNGKKIDDTFDSNYIFVEMSKFESYSTVFMRQFFLMTDILREPHNLIEEDSNDFEENLNLVTSSFSRPSHQ